MGLGMSPYSLALRAREKGKEYDIEICKACYLRDKYTGKVACPFESRDLPIVGRREPGVLPEPLISEGNEVEEALRKLDRDIAIDAAQEIRDLLRENP
jgi:hypothetical protein